MVYLLPLANLHSHRLKTKIQSCYWITRQDLGPLGRQTAGGPRRPVVETINNQKSGMAHEIAKLMLEHAGTFLERAEAIRVAISLGMPLNDIETYLDWLDAVRGPLPAGPEEEESTGDKPTGD